MSENRNHAIEKRLKSEVASDKADSKAAAENLLNYLKDYFRTIKDIDITFKIVTSDGADIAHIDILTVPKEKEKLNDEDLHNYVYDQLKSVLGESLKVAYAFEYDLPCAVLFSDPTIIKKIEQIKKASQNEAPTLSDGEAVANKPGLFSSTTGDVKAQKPKEQSVEERADSKAQSGGDPSSTSTLSAAHTDAKPLSTEESVDAKSNEAPTLSAGEAVAKKPGLFSSTAGDDKAPKPEEEWSLYYFQALKELFKEKYPEDFKSEYFKVDNEKVSIDRDVFSRFRNCRSYLKELHINPAFSLRLACFNISLADLAQSPEVTEIAAEIAEIAHAVKNSEAKARQ